MFIFLKSRKVKITVKWKKNVKQMKPNNEVIKHWSLQPFNSRMFGRICLSRLPRANNNSTSSGIKHQQGGGG